LHCNSFAKVFAHQHIREDSGPNSSYSMSSELRYKEIPGKLFLPIVVFPAVSGTR